MNKLIIALSLSCASACVFADVGATPSKVTTNTWFSASVSGSSPSTNGCVVTSGTQPTIENGKFVIDSELGSPVTFTPTNSVAQDMTAVSFVLDTAVVPADSRQDLSTRGAKVAFAASETANNEKAYFAWLGGDAGWVQLDGGAAVGSDGDSYTLDVTFDNRDGGKKVQFKVGGEALHTNGVEWLSYASAAVSHSAFAIDLVGSGNVTSIGGNLLTIETEVVVVDGGKIEIKEEDMEAFKESKGSYKTVEEFIAADASTAFGSTNFETKNISVGAAYALGLVVKDENNKMVPKDNGVLIAKALAENSDSDGIKLGLNVTPPDNTGATITYQVVDLASNNVVTNTPLIPKSALSTGLKKFKVQATVKLADE